jgi:Rrf2 family cysteine metabolism transcriptional repressor
MKLSTKTRYATRAMLDLALNSGEEVVSARQLAARQDISAKYLEQLLASLRSAGLVRTVRGARGGHTLSRQAGEINLREIYEVFEGVEGFVECTTSPELCQRSDTCVTQGVWAELYGASMEILESITLEDLTRRARDKERA